MSDEKNITPEEFKNAMEAVFKSHDIELRHAEADQIMCDTLRELGYEDGVKVFEEAYKWHA